MGVASDFTLCYSLHVTIVILKMATDIENYVSCSLVLNSKVLDLSGKDLRTIPFSYEFLRNIEVDIFVFESRSLCLG